ncbi:SMP-30/gluconolactonase/LRE family protein [Flavisphingomonas formosensis]|uniref:SMP-30/gluconolactonase/LRE family protein n=1 Tax=Flavisphingomonas formosensis TaxID=861534 RepID=UPI0012FA939A|nr:SMP-30/gluconolactonase/LRE family protein [Sphingomonas formosensis]
MSGPETIASGLAFPEGPRWHSGRLWVSDQHEGSVHVMDERGRVEERFAVPGGPSGMGWLPDGDLLVVSMEERRLYRRGADRTLTVHAELAPLHPGHSNDMVVDRFGRAYVGNIGFAFDRGEEPCTTAMALVMPDGGIACAADELLCPNGSVITPDGRTLIVAESLAGRLTAFTIGADGRLADRRCFAAIDGHVPDGICLDAEGYVWAASPFAQEVIRVREGGEIVERVRITEGAPYACALGGKDGRSLFICCAPDHAREATLAARGGRIDRVTVTVPAALEMA